MAKFLNWNTIIRRSPGRSRRKKLEIISKSYHSCVRIGKHLIRRVQRIRVRRELVVQQLTENVGYYWGEHNISRKEIRERTYIRLKALIKLSRRNNCGRSVTLRCNPTTVKTQSSITSPTPNDSIAHSILRNTNNNRFSRRIAFFTREYAFFTLF